MKTRVLLSMGLLACNGTAETTVENTAVASAEALSEATDASSALELQGLLELVRPLEEMHPVGPGALGCDASPDVTKITVCGKELPGTAHFEWTDCSAQEMRGAPGKGAPSPDGSEENDAAPSDSKRFRRGFANSSGTVDINVTATAPEVCDDATVVTLEQSATFDIKHTANDGSVGETKGTSQAVSTRTPASKRATSRTKQLDIARSRTDANGTLVHSLHLTGSLATANDDTAKTRTIDGEVAYEALKDGATTSGTIKLQALVRVPPDVCFWPTSGSITRTTADSTQTLVFSATCGSATLDDVAVDLTSLVPEHPRKHHRPRALR